MKSLIYVWRVQKLEILEPEGRVKKYEVNDKVICRNYGDHSIKWVPVHLG